MGNSFAICGFLLLAVTTLHGATRIWVGAPGTNWSDPANWADNALPTPADKVSITNDAHIVVDRDYSADEPAASNLVTQSGCSVKISGGHTLYLYNGATNMDVSAGGKIVNSKAALEVTGSGTKVYAMSYLPNSEKNDATCQGVLNVTGGAYFECNAFRPDPSTAISAIGSDANGVRSKIVIGAGSQRLIPTDSQFVADGGDVVLKKYEDARRKWDLTAANYKPTVVARNGGTNDWTEVNFGNRGGMYATAESGGAIVFGNLPCHNMWSDATQTNETYYDTFHLTNGVVYANAIPGYYDYSRVYLTFAGDTPLLSVNELNLGKPGAKEYKGGEIGFADVTLAPTPAWTNNDCIVEMRDASKQLNLGTNLIFRLDVTGLKNWADRDGGTLVVPVFKGSRDKNTPIVVPSIMLGSDGRWHVTDIVGYKPERYTASFGFRGDGELKRFYDLTITKARKPHFSLTLR